MYKSLLTTCAAQADEIARHYYRSHQYKIETKADTSPVTQADKEIEQKIRSIVSKTMPGMEIFGEEFGKCDPNASLKLIIDPIDGTQNFIRKLPFFATLLAVEEKGEIVAGLISAPLLNQRWSAYKGQGAHQDHRKITVSTTQDLQNAQAFYGSLFGNEAPEDVRPLLKVLSKTKRQRGLGDFYAHVMIAEGAGDFSLDYNLNPWDIAPLKIIVEEAGGQLTNHDGHFDLYTGRNILVSNGQIHSKVVDLLNPKPVVNI